MLYMRNILILCILATIPAYAQTTSYTQGVKLYANIATTPFRNFLFYKHLGYSHKTTVRNYLTPSISYTWQNRKRNYHEIEWHQLDMRKEKHETEYINPITGERSYQQTRSFTTTTIALRYEYIFNLSKKKNRTFMPSVGIAAMPAYHRNSSTPYTGSDYPTSQAYIGIRHFVIPRIHIAVTNRLMVDINIPISVVDAGVISNKILNPTLPNHAQKYSVADFTLFPAYHTARIGVMLKI